MLRLPFFFLFFVFFVPMQALADGSAMPFQNWWVSVAGESAFECTRFILDEEPARAVTIVMRKKDDAGAVLQFHETAFLGRWSIEEKTLRYALPEAPEGKEHQFVIESESTATKLRSGGTYWLYKSLPQISRLAGPLENPPAGGLRRFTGRVRSAAGDDLFFLDAQKRMITPLSGLFIKNFGEGPYAVRFFQDTWNAEGRRETTVVGFMTKDKRQVRFTVQRPSNTAYLEVDYATVQILLSEEQQELLFGR